MVEGPCSATDQRYRSWNCQPRSRQLARRNSGVDRGWPHVGSIATPAPHHSNAYRSRRRGFCSRFHFCGAPCCRFCWKEASL